MADQERNAVTPIEQSAPTSRLESRLAVYVAAAGAAGVGLLALAQPAAADIIYTPTNSTIGPPSGFSSISIDLNHDGISDFTLKNEFLLGTSGSVLDNLYLNDGGTRNRAVFASGGTFFKFAANLAAGQKIGPSQRFGSGFYQTEVEQKINSSLYGRFGNVTNAYLGLEFETGGQEYYGWARINVLEGDGGLVTTLTGYAYNNVAGQDILAGQTTSTPEPGTLGLLALGSLGLGLWRRRKRSGGTKGT